ncbi:MAG: hypothetical protein LKI39_02385 [Bacteroides sp.]|jgi:hypothetical protein|nr:hypothetical protein [Bacteroides sp.]MCI1681384.1 hypothetical protein [Bacteroides sp.]
MKKITFAVVVLLTILMVVPTTMYAQKKKKEKKKFEWVMPTASGNKDFDDYLYACDSLWTKMGLYQESITSYQLREDTIKTADSKIYILSHMENADGKLMTKGAANWQLAESVLAGVSILTNSMQITAQTASATAALPSLGLKAFSYGKYVKAGPLIVGKAGKEIKELVLKRKEQMKKWKDMKNKNVDPSSLGLTLNDNVLSNIQKSYFIKEFKPEDTGYDETVTLWANKTDEEITASVNDIITGIDAKTVLPEEAGKTLDEVKDMDDDELLKDSQGA